MQLRRMSKCIRLGIGAAATCVELSGRPGYKGSVHVGTALGMLSDSELFLKTLLEREEQMLTPTAFIQSTHNTVAGTIALHFSSHGHNMTFADGGHSFENALWDAELLLNEQGGTALVGATDEYTTTSLRFMEHLHLFPPGVPVGEGAAFFLLSRERSPDTLARLSAFECHSVQHGTAASVTSAFRRFAAGSGGGVRPGDRLVTGFLAEDRHAAVYTEIQEEHFPDPSLIIPYKHWSGHYPTASATGLAVALQTQRRHPRQATWMISGWENTWSFWKLEA